jgi:hypothetical protein
VVAVETTSIVDDVPSVVNMDWDVKAMVDEGGLVAAEYTTFVDTLPLVR